MNVPKLKENLILKCCAILEEKILLVDKELEILQKSANSETKSSAGDKYETGRAMLMLEKEKYAGQKTQLLNQLKSLKAVDPEKTLTKAAFGAIVCTSSFNYFIATGIGKIEVGSDEFLVLSAMAPVAQAMLGKGNGDEFAFGGKKFTIQKLF